jgi:hypothetical protein
MTHPASQIKTSSSPTQLTRVDVATLASVYKTKSKKSDRWETAGIFGGLITGWLLMTAGSRFGWGDSWDAAFFFAGWGIAVTSMTLGWLHRKRIVAELQLHCANCSAPLLEPPTFLRRLKVREGLARADLIVATGGCPSCGGDFIGGEP